MGNKYITSLENAIKKQNDVQDWIFTFSSSEKVEVGMENGQIGGPYTPPTVRKGFQADMYVVWKNGSVSEATLEPHQFRDLDTAIAELRVNSYNDPDAPSVLQPGKYPKLKLYDSKVAGLMKNSGLLFDILNTYLSILKSAGASNIEGSALATVARKYLRSSTGMNEQYRSTSLISYGLCEGQFGEEDESAKLPSLDDVRKLAERAVSFYHINQVKARMPEGLTEIILSPDVGRSFMEFYLGKHLDGSRVVEKKSQFTLEDFQTEKHAFHPSLTLVLDGIAPYETSSAPFDDHGIPGGFYELIKDGTLKTPILNAKWGTKLGMDPTGAGEFYASVPDSVSLDDMIKYTDDGVVIHQILGLHTQSYEKGDYSVPVTIAHRVKNGEIVGSGKVSLTGNIFDDLKGDVEFCYDPLHPRSIGYKVMGKVTPMA